MLNLKGLSNSLKCKLPPDFYNLFSESILEEYSSLTEIGRRLRPGRRRVGGRGPARHRGRGRHHPRQGRRGRVLQQVRGEPAVHLVHI